MTVTQIPDRHTWKQDLAPYLEVDRTRSLGQIASVVLPYLGVWVLAAIVQPGAWLAVGLGLVATVFLVRMYSFFHDLTHNSMFESRAANTPLGLRCSASCCSRPTAGGSASTASTTRTRATSTSAGRARSTR